jgi:hypothetical protein
MGVDPAGGHGDFRHALLGVLGDLLKLPHQHQLERAPDIPALFIMSREELRPRRLDHLFHQNLESCNARSRALKTRNDVFGNRKRLYS